LGNTSARCFSNQDFNSNKQGPLCLALTMGRTDSSWDFVLCLIAISQQIRAAVLLAGRSVSKELLSKGLP